MSSDQCLLFCAQGDAAAVCSDFDLSARLQAVESSRDAHQIKAENLQRRYDDLKAEKERLVVERDRLQFEGERRHNGYDGEAEDWRRKGRVLEEQADALRAQVMAVAHRTPRTPCTLLAGRRNGTWTEHLWDVVQGDAEAHGCRDVAALTFEGPVPVCAWSGLPSPPTLVERSR